MSTQPSRPDTAGWTSSGGQGGEPAAKRSKTEGDGERPMKRKIALLLAYNGAGYQGLQKNPGAVTVEETLESAIHRAGGISDDNIGTLQKISWSRAGRTDKGVHAVGQIISLKMLLLQPELDSAMMERINAELADEAIRILACARVVNSFSAHTSCEAREYEYILPAYVLRQQQQAPVTDEPAFGGARDPADPLTEKELGRLNGFLKQLEGTHYFHNFTDGKLKPTDKQVSCWFGKRARRALRTWAYALRSSTGMQTLRTRAICSTHAYTGYM